MKYFLIIFSILLLFGCEDKKNNLENMFSDREKPQEPILYNLDVVNAQDLQIEFVSPSKINIKTDKYKNKIILVDFWATWCPSCVSEIPNLNNVYLRHKKYFNLIGVNIEQDKSLVDISKFVKKHNMKYFVTSNDRDFGKDLMRNLTNVRVLPFKILFNQKGEYVKHYYGAVPEALIESDINNLLSSK